MRKLFWLILVLWCAQAWAVPTLVQKCPSGGITGGNNSGTSVACSFGSNNTVHNAIIIVAMTDNAAATLSIADSRNTYTLVDSSMNTGVMTAAMWVVCDAGAGANTVTVSFASTGNSYIGGAEYSGLATTNCIDQNQQTNELATTNWTTGATVTRSQASELMIGFAAGGDGSLTFTAGTNVAWTREGSTNTGNRSPAWEDFVASSAGTNAATWTNTSTSGTVFIATFNSSNPAATIPRHVQMCPSNNDAHGFAIGYAASSTTVACSFVANNTAGNTIAVFGLAVASVTLSVADSRNSYTAIVSNAAVGTGRVGSIWYAPNIGAGANTITVTASGSAANFYVGAVEISGVSTTTPFDKGPNGAAGLTSGTTATTSEANEILLGWVLGGSGSTSPTAGTGYTILGSEIDGNGSPGYEYKSVTSTGTYSASFATGDAASSTTYITTFGTPAGGVVRHRAAVIQR